MVSHMSTGTRTPPRLGDLQSGDTVTIQDGKGQQLTGKVHSNARDRIWIKAFEKEIVLAKWVPSKMDPGEGIWKATYRIVDWVAPIPGL
jgi:hypothetical protein